MIPLLPLIFVSHLLLSFSFADSSSLKRLIQEGIEFQNQDRCARAIDAFKRVLKVRPQKFRLYNRIGACFEKLDYPRLARKYYLKTLSYDPQNQVAGKRVLSLIESEPRAPSEPPGVNSVLVPERPQTQVQDLKRLFLVRNDYLFTLQSNGSDLRQYSSEKLGQLFPVPGSHLGIPLVKTSDYGMREIFFLEPEAGSLTFVEASVEDAHSPLYIPSKNRLFFLAGKSPTTRIYSLNPDQKEKPQTHLQGLKEVLEMIWHPQSEHLYLSARSDSKAPSRIYSWDLKTDLRPISPGRSDEEGILLSPNGKSLVYRRRQTENRWDFVLHSFEDSSQKDLSFFKSSVLNGVFSPDSTRLYFASSVPGEKDPLRSTLGFLEIETGFVTPLLEHNFSFKNLLVDKMETYLYYLTDYDNQFEVYRLELESKTQERLTLSEQDETQIGFWD